MTKANVEEKFNLIDLIYELDPKTKDDELRMHEVLYLLYGFLCAASRGTKELFEPKFKAFSFGPVEVNYRNFYETNNREFIEKFNITNDLLILKNFRYKSEKGWEINIKDLMKFIFKYFLVKIEKRELVEFSLLTDPWIKTSIEHDVNKIYISKELMNNYFQGNFIFEFKLYYRRMHYRRMRSR